MTSGLTRVKGAHPATSRPARSKGDSMRVRVRTAVISAGAVWRGRQAVPSNHSTTTMKSSMVWSVRRFSISNE